MAVENDPFRSLLNSVQVAIAPLESNFQNLLNNFEHCVTGALSFNNCRKGKVPMKMCVRMDETKADFCHADLLQERNGLSRNENRWRFQAALPFLVHGAAGIKLKELNVEEDQDLPFLHLKRFLCDQFDVFFQDDESKKVLKAFSGNFKGNLMFARLPRMKELIELLPQLGRCSKQEQDLFRCSEAQGKRFFEELDRDGDGQVSLEDVEIAMTNRKLPSNHHQEKTRRIQSDSVVKTALAGGISCSFSTLLMHPIDTVKTQVQASTTLSFMEILSKLPQLGLRGLYMGSIPAIVGQFTSHGLRTGICEVTKIVLINAAPSLPEIQAESVGSFLGTFVGTCMRIPCEVLKQRLQAGQFNHVGEALVETWQQGGLFRGTAMTLCRELPFYVAGSALYTQSNKVVRKFLGRELQPWETIVVGAVSGGLTAVSTTPFDVIKTRMMTALQGQPATMSVVALAILRDEGPLGLFRGAIPRFFWVAPLYSLFYPKLDLRLPQPPPSSHHRL